jgi:O-antigen ligase
MKGLISISPADKGKLQRIHSFLTVCFLTLFGFPLYPLAVTNVLLITLYTGIMIAYLIKPFPVHKLLLRNLVFIIPFLPYLIEFCVSGFTPVSGFEFEKKLFFFTAPLFLPLFMEITGFRAYRQALLVFAFSVVALTLFSVAGLMFQGIPFHASSYINGAYLLRDGFEKLSHVHPTYYSIFALTSACFLIDTAYRQNRAAKIILALLAVLLFAAALFIAARMAVVTGGIFLLVWILRSRMKLIKKMVFGCLALAVLIALSFAIPSLKNRFSEVVSWAGGKDITGNTVSQRVMIMDCSFKVFSDHLLLGTGNRYFQKELNYCYRSKEFPLDDKQSFNPHNQYLSIGINYGLFCFLAFLFCLFMIFRRIFKYPSGIYFGIAISLFFLSESMLERQMGVYFFGMIALLLYNIPIEMKDQQF